MQADEAEEIKNPKKKVVQENTSFGSEYSSYYEEDYGAEEAVEEGKESTPVEDLAQET